MSPDILGPHAGLVVGARALLKPRERRDRSLFLVEGPQAVHEAIEAGVVKTLLVDHTRDSVVAQFAGAIDALVSPKALASMSDTETPQGVVAICGMPIRGLSDVLDANTRTVVVCVGLQDPGNLGTVIRTAHATGADAVFLTSGSVDLYNSKVLRATVGSLFHVPVVQGLAVDDIHAALDACGVQSFGLAGAADLSLFEIDDANLREPTAWWLGSEAQGLPDALRSRIEFVSIPMPGGTESLNVGVAAAVALYAGVRANAIRGTK